MDQIGPRAEEVCIRHHRRWLQPKWNPDHLRLARTASWVSDSLSHRFLTAVSLLVSLIHSFAVSLTCCCLTALSRCCLAPTSQPASSVSHAHTSVGSSHRSQNSLHQVHNSSDSSDQCSETMSVPKSPTQHIVRPQQCLVSYAARAPSRLHLSFRLFRHQNCSLNEL